jgi:hypothetical protein
MIGSGRRTLLSVILAIPITYYWIRLRSLPSYGSIIKIMAFGFLGLLLVTAYSGLRHRDRKEGSDRDVTFALDSIALLPGRISNASNLTEMAQDQVLGQRAVEFSLLAKKTYYDSFKGVSYFQTLIDVLVAPVPRGLWPDKPEGLGKRLPIDVRAPTRATWGPGIVGHGFHDGGYWVLALYGVMLGFGLRVLDEYLRNDPANPFLIGIFASISTHLIGWTRGDCATFTVQTISGIVGGILVAWVTRLFLARTSRKTLSYSTTLR